MKNKPILYLMLGYPGAGKTTVAEKIAKFTGAVHLNSDWFRLHMFKKPTFSQEEHDSLYGNLDYLCELILTTGKSVIYDANLNRYIHRQEKYDIAKRVGAKVRLIYINTDLETAKHRATVEAEKNPQHRPYGNLAPANFDRLASEIELPKPSEPTTVVSEEQFDDEKLLKQLKISDD
ncbi:ATP-binding protein [Candidatus Parcubacteria bacterium]|nr:ATP-binding protein [Candidatus Parcubacteria bacterium]